MIKRYEPAPERYSGCDMCYASVKECEIGDYVKYEDVVTLVKLAIGDETKDDVVSSLLEGFGIQEESND